MQLQEVLHGSLELGTLTCIHGLGVVPLLLSDEVTELPTIDLLDQALGKGNVKITETSEGGEVPFLKVDNTGENHILILEGEELVGGKQNRVVNTSLLVLAGLSVKIPVSCMEAGRWQSRQIHFDSGHALFRAKSRAVHKQNVTFSIRTEGSYRGSQGAVWDEVSDSLAEFGVPSPTSDFRAGRERVAHRIEVFVEEIQALDKQVGAVFLAQSGILGVELLGSAELFGVSLPKIVRSFAFEVLSDEDLANVTPDGAEAWWQEVLSATVTKHLSPGAGDDLRCDAQDLVGSGLYWNNTVLHFSCFPEANLAQQIPPSRTRRASVSERRNRIRNL